MDFPAVGDNLRGLSLPAMVVDLAAFDRNVERVSDTVSSRPDLKIRVATKSLRVPDLIRRVLDRGKPFAGLMCFAAREIGLLVEQGFDDFLLAYPTVQRADLKILREVHEKGKILHLMVDHADSVAVLAEAFAGVVEPVNVMIELDCSLRAAGFHLGVRRSPIRTPESVLALVREIEKRRELRFSGLMGYEAQIAGLGDRNPFHRSRNPLAASVRALSRRSVYRLRKSVMDHLQKNGVETAVYNGGGSGSLNYSIEEPWLTEVTVGSAFFCPHLFDYYSNQKWEPCCFFTLSVTRSSDPGWVTCQQGGFIASGESGSDRSPIPVWPEGLRLSSSEGCGEVQTPLQVPPRVRLKVGDVVFFRHAKAGELAEHFGEVILVKGSQIGGTAKTYRGLGL